jgi:hypothetical protein
MEVELETFAEEEEEEKRKLQNFERFRSLAPKSSR